MLFVVRLTINQEGKKLQPSNFEANQFSPRIRGLEEKQETEKQSCSSLFSMSNSLITQIGIPTVIKRTRCACPTVHV